MKTLNFNLLILSAIGFAIIGTMIMMIATEIQYINAQVTQNKSCAAPCYYNHYTGYCDMCPLTSHPHTVTPGEIYVSEISAD